MSTDPELPTSETDEHLGLTTCVATIEREMEAIWVRIEAFLQTHPALRSSTAPFLNPPATEEEILAAEAALGLSFPADFRASLALHNGQARGEVLLGMGPLLSTTEIVDDWRIWNQLLEEGTFEENCGEPESGVKGDWWNKRWIPITRDGGGNHDCLDMDPAEGGSVGQVIEMWHDDYPRPVQARGFAAWVARAVEDLEAGKLVWEDGVGFFPKEEEEELAASEKEAAERYE